MSELRYRGDPSIRAWMREIEPEPTVAHLGLNIAHPSDEQRLKDSMLPVVLAPSKHRQRFRLVEDRESSWRRYFSLRWPMYVAVAEQTIVDSLLPVSWWDNLAAAHLEVRERLYDLTRGVPQSMRRDALVVVL